MGIGNNRKDKWELKTGSQGLDFVPLAIGVGIFVGRVTM